MDRRTRVRPAALIALLIIAFGLGGIAPANARIDQVFGDDPDKRCDLSVDLKAVTQEVGGYLTFLAQTTCGIAAPQAHIAYQKLFLSRNAPGGEGNVWRGALAGAHHDPLQHVVHDALHEAACHTAPCWDVAWPPDAMAAGIPCGGGTVPSGVHEAETFNGTVVDDCSGEWNVLVLTGLASLYAAKDPTGTGTVTQGVKAPGTSWTVHQNGDHVFTLGHAGAQIQHPGSQCTQQTTQQGTSPANIAGRANQSISGAPLNGPRDMAAYDLPTTTLCYAQFGFTWTT